MNLYKVLSITNFLFSLTSLDWIVGRVFDLDLVSSCTEVSINPGKTKTRSVMITMCCIQAYHKAIASLLCPCIFYAQPFHEYSKRLMQNFCTSTQTQTQKDVCRHLREIKFFSVDFKANMSKFVETKRKLSKCHYVSSRGKFPSAPRSKYVQVLLSDHFMWKIQIIVNNLYVVSWFGLNVATELNGFYFVIYFLWFY